jgi:hypothetical protein
VTQITLDPYGVTFSLSRGRSQMRIASGGRFAYSFEGIDDMFEASDGCPNQGPVRFHALLNQTVATLTGSPERDALTFAFRRRPTMSESVGIATRRGPEGQVPA